MLALVLLRFWPLCIQFCKEQRRPYEGIMVIPERVPASATDYSPALSPPTPASDLPSENLSTDYFSFVEPEPRRSR